MTNKNHRSNEVKTLTDIEHVRQKPNMYIGATEVQTTGRWTLSKDGESIEYREVQYVPGILKMFDEIISNSIDEALRTNFDHANKIAVKIDGNCISVEDNGRGISSRVNKELNKTEAEIAFTHLRSGSNFGSESFVSIGTHGLGASLVNILSSRFKAKTCDGKYNVTMNCRMLPTNELSTSVTKTRSKNNGTYVEFVPDFNLFGVKNLNVEIVRLMQKRVIDLALCFPKIQFKMNGKIVRTQTLRKYLKMISEHAEIIETDNASIGVFPSDEPNQISFVNGIDTYEGGTHVNVARQKISHALLEKLQKKYKKLNLRANDVTNKVCWVVVTNNIPNPKFRSQTKEFITNQPSEFNDVFEGIDDPAFIGRVLRNEEIIDPIIETKKLKVEAQERIQLKRDNKRIKRVKVPKHVPANGEPSETTLYITEGDSASGMMTKVRDPRKHGCFPLRGKPMNTWGKSPLKVMQNNELRQLMAVLNLKIGEKVEDLNYGAIKILCDADMDGHCIVSLLLAFFSNWKELFEEKKISLVRCPIIVATKKNHQERRYYHMKDYVTAKESGEIDSTWNLAYLKGLGSLNEKEYERMIHNPVEDEIVIDAEWLNALELAFGSDSNPRKTWLEG